MILYEGKIAVTVAELTDSVDEAIMSYPNYKALAHRGSIVVLRPGKGLEHPALVDYQSLPERFKSKYVAKYGNPETMIREKENMLVINEEARTFYAEYTLEDGSHLKERFIKEYTLNASVLDRLIGMENKQRACRNMRCNRTPVQWGAIVDEANRLREEKGHTLPKGEARLRDKMRQYRKESFMCLISGKLANGNTCKVTEEGLDILVKLKRSRFPVYTNSQILSEYNRIAVARGWKRLKSQATVNNILEAADVKPRWFSAVFGELKTKTKYARQNVTLLPEYRDALWYGDGTKINLYYKTYKDGKAVATSLQVFEVIDAYSEALIGHHISEREDFESMYWAYRSAIEFARHKPYEIVFDNQGGTKREDARDFLKKIATCSRPTAPHNAPSKTIESAFGRFQSQVLHKHWYFTGANITAQADRSRVNLEFILANVDQLPTREELCAIYEADRAEWNSMPHPKYKESRLSLYQSSRNEKSVELTQAMMLDMFYLRTKKKCTFTNRGLAVTINGEQRIYDVYGADGFTDMEWRSKHTGDKFIVQYLPDNLEVVRLCYEDKNYGLQFVTEARPYEVFHRALQDQTQEERERLRRYDEMLKKDRIRRDIEAQEFDIKHGISPEQHGLSSPKPLGIGNKTYERIADKITIEEQENMPEEFMPLTIGQIQKEMSNQDMLSAYDKM